MHRVNVNNLQRILYYSITFLFFISSSPLFSQGNDNIHKKAGSHTRPKLVKLRNADAKNAIEIQDSIAGPFNVSLGYGRINEIDYRDSEGQLCSELNYACFKLTAEYDTTFTFDIVPIDSLDDYDFVLFKCEAVNCIGNKEKFKKIRACWSNCTSKSGMTGLSEYTANTEIARGGGPAYASSVKVKSGETYYLMVDYDEAYLNWGRQPAGFTIYFYNYYPRKKPIVLNNIFFETGKAVLKTESFPVLEILVGLLRKSQMVIEVRGHTDNEGDEKKNKQLSEDRAKAVVDYLLSKKINKNRLFYKGFGSLKPLASNDTKEGRQKNRRVEFVKVMY
jgi:outer membrane protein OmpA-like peptidoglycan-associated protein